MALPTRAPSSTPDESLSALEAISQILAMSLGDAETLRLLNQLHIRVGVLVIDTNHLLSDLEYRVRHGYQTGLMEAARMGGTRLEVGVHVRGEVEEHLQAFCTRRHLDVDAMRQVWRDEYSPHLAVVDTSALPPLSTAVRVLATRDRDDVPTGQLAELLQPDAILSRDTKHLAAFGIVEKDTARLAVAYRTVARRDVIVLGMVSGTSYALVLTVGAVEGIGGAAGALLSRVDRRVCWTILALLGLVGVALFVWPSSRRWFLDHARKPLAVVGNGLEAYAAMEAAAREARRSLDQVQRQETSAPKTAREYASRVLGRAPIALTISTLANEMRLLGYAPRSNHPERHVARMLRQHPDLFMQIGRYHWRLRQPVAGGRPST